MTEGKSGVIQVLEHGLRLAQTSQREMSPQNLVNMAARNLSATFGTLKLATLELEYQVGGYLNAWWVSRGRSQADVVSLFEKALKSSRDHEGLRTEGEEDGSATRP